VINDGDADSNAVTRNVTVTPVNDPPVLANTVLANYNYMENRSKSVSPLITVLDVDYVSNMHLTSAVVTISSGIGLGDTLAVPANTGLVASYRADTGVLRLSGKSLSQAQWQGVLRSVVFASTSQDPKGNQSAIDRVVSFIINDGDTDSNTVTQTVKMICHAGKYLLTSPPVCLGCASGQYQDETGQLSCKFCDNGKQLKSWSTLRSNDAGADCKACEAGKWLEGTGAVCKGCQSGQYQPLPGQINCSVCERGQYQPQNISIDCNDCPNGKFQPLYSGTSCISCEIGKIGSGNETDNVLEGEACSRCPCVCTDECPFANDGVCDDGGPGAGIFEVCRFGTDCSDCAADANTSQLNERRHGKCGDQDMPSLFCSGHGQCQVMSAAEQSTKCICDEGFFSASVDLWRLNACQFEHVLSRFSVGVICAILSFILLTSLFDFDLFCYVTSSLVQMGKYVAWPLQLILVVFSMVTFVIANSALVKMLSEQGAVRFVFFVWRFLLRFMSQLLRLCFDVYVLSKSFKLVAPNIYISVGLPELFEAVRLVLSKLLSLIGTLTLYIPWINIPLKFVLVDVFGWCAQLLESWLSVFDQFSGE
jgi:hypothetical protein